MKSLRFVFFVVTIFSFGISFGKSEPYTIKKDLLTEWLVYDENQYKPFAQQEDIHTIYFFINANKFGGDYLTVTSAYDFTLFVNGKLAAENGKRFSLDSLASVFGSTSLLIG